MPTALDPARIGEALRGLGRPVTLVLHPAPQEGGLGLRLAELARAIADASGGTVALGEEEEGDDPPARPALTLAAGDRRNIRYLALPEGPEAAPFLGAVCGLGGEAPRSSTGALADLQRPAALIVFVAAACPRCPQAASAANDLAIASPLVTSTIVDAQRYPRLAERFNVRSVPFTVIDGGLCLTGVVPPDELIGHLLARDAAGFGAKVFSSLIEAGRLDDAARHVLEGGAADFPPAWLGSTMSSRMALLLASETALEQARDCLDAAVPDLLPGLEAAEASLRGDTADLLGRIGHRSALEPLEHLLRDPNPDVIEIAEEALEDIRARRDDE